MTAGAAVRWLWAGNARAVAAARVALAPLALTYSAVMRLRAAAYRRGLLRVRRLPLPTVAVGNLSVGGTGKTPLAAWVARHYAERGRTPGILLRGYGGDEPLVHRRLVPAAVVVADPDRGAGAARAQAAGADVLVLDDAFQLLSVARDLNIAVVSAESVGRSAWPLPAGPWREGWGALARADVIVVTRKHAPPEAAEALARRLEAQHGGAPVPIAHLALGPLQGMQSGTPRELGLLAGRRVFAAAGIADPDSFGAQLAAAGAIVQLQAYQDHHAYSAADLARLVRGSAEADYVVVTEKDAVKLRGRWPGEVPEPLVAGLVIRWERHAGALERALDRVVAHPHRP